MDDSRHMSARLVICWLKPRRLVSSVALRALSVLLVLLGPLCYNGASARHAADGGDRHGASTGSSRSSVGLVGQRRMLQAAGATASVDAAAAAAAAGYPSVGAVLVSTAAQLAVAIADPAVQVAVLAGSLLLTEADWAPVAQPLVEVRRNLTLLGARADPAAWPTINFGYTANLDGVGIVKSAKVRVAPGFTLTFRHVVLQNSREAPHWLFVGLDVVAAASPPPNSTVASAWPTVLLHEAVLWQRTCLPVVLKAASSRSSPRPVFIPGAQNTTGTYVPDLPCEASAAAPPMTRCWPARGTYYNLALYAYNQDAFNRQIPAGYVLHGLDVPYWCDHLMSDECVASKGSFLACFYSFYPYSRAANSTFASNLTATNNGSAAAGGGSSAPASAAGALLSPAPAGGLSQHISMSGGGSGGSTSASTGMIVGCVVGGFVALVLVAAAAALLVMRHRSQQHRPSDYAAGATYGMPSSASSDGGASGLAAAVCVVKGGSSQPHFSDSASGTLCSGGSSKAPLSTATTTCRAKGSATPESGRVVDSDCGGASVVAATTASAAAMQWPPPLAIAAVATTADSAALEQHLSRHLQQQEALVTSATPFRENLNVRASVEACSHPDSIPAQSQAQTSDHVYLSTVNSNAFGDFRFRQAHAHASSHPDQLPPGQGSTAVTSGATAALAALAVRPTSCMGAVGQGAQQDSAGAVDSGSEGDSVVHLLPVVLGKGGFGRVVAGMYRGQPVAVKQLLDDAWWAAGAGPRPAGASIVDAGQRDELVHAFVQEVEILGRCDHPNVARLHAVCLTPPHLSLVLERCETSLDKLIYGGAGKAAAGGRDSPGGGGEDKSEPLGARIPPPLLPLSKVLHIAIQVAKGLEYLHPTIVHRDLKPANVLLNDADGPSPVAKLSDFGLSRMRNATQSTMQPQAGTAAYLAPECFSMEGSTPVGCRADIYSFGVLLWTMLSGAHPWADFSLVAIAFKVGLQQQRLPLEHLQAAGRCTPKLEKLIVQCWETDPLRRPAAGEVWKALMLCEQELRGAA